MTDYVLNAETAVSPKKRMHICIGCGHLIDPDIGTGLCGTCAKTKCLERCLPSGTGSDCVACERGDS